MSTLSRRRSGHSHQPARTLPTTVNHWGRPEVGCATMRRSVKHVVSPRPQKKALMQTIAIRLNPKSDTSPSTLLKKLCTLLDLCVSSLRRGHANLLCIVPILTDDPRRESTKRGDNQGDTSGIISKYSLLGFTDLARCVRRGGQISARCPRGSRGGAKNKLITQ